MSLCLAGLTHIDDTSWALPLTLLGSLWRNKGQLTLFSHHSSSLCLPAARWPIPPAIPSPPSSTTCSPFLSSSLSPPLRNHQVFCLASVSTLPSSHPSPPFPPGMIHQSQRVNSGLSPPLSSGTPGEKLLPVSWAAVIIIAPLPAVQRRNSKGTGKEIQKGGSHPIAFLASH